MRSPHVLIDEELDALADPATPIICSALVQRTLTEMMSDQRITIEEFNHYGVSKLQPVQNFKRIPKPNLPG